MQIGVKSHNYPIECNYTKEPERKFKHECNTHKLK